MSFVKFTASAMFGSSLLMGAVAGLALGQQKSDIPAGPTTRPYPLDTCIVSGEKLGSMGNAVAITYEGREIKFCCKDCPADFKKDPARYLKKLDEAIAKLPATKPSGG
jgi:YHS domain-containing protein